MGEWDVGGSSDVEARIISTTLLARWPFHVVCTLIALTVCKLASAMASLTNILLARCPGFQASTRGNPSATHGLTHPVAT